MLTDDEVREAVQDALHEIGHYFGANESTVRGWGL
jgi:predicted Zn-dependent protease with MMP-like domain